MRRGALEDDGLPHAVMAGLVPAIHDLALRHAARMTIGRNGQCCAVGKRWQLEFGTEGIEVEGESGGGENKGDHRVKAVAHARAYGPKRDIREE